MNYFSDLPTELCAIIIKYGTIRDVYHLTQITKRLNQLIASNINDCIYMTINKNNTLDIISEGKQFLIADFFGNRSFTLQNEELIVHKLTIPEYIVLVTMQKQLYFNLYVFANFGRIKFMRANGPFTSIKSITFPYRCVNMSNHDCECATSQCANCINYFNDQIKKKSANIITEILNN